MHKLIQINTRLMEDLAILTQFNATLKNIIDFEDSHGRNFTPELVDIVEKHSSIMEGLFNITMVTEEGVVGSGEGSRSMNTDTTDGGAILEDVRMILLCTNVNIHYSNTS